jgi:hypothetical protein
MDNISLIDEVLANKNIKRICFITNNNIQYFVLSEINNDKDMVLGYYPLGLYNPSHVSSYEEINTKRKISFDCSKGLHSNDLIIIGDDPDIEEATYVYSFNIQGIPKTTYTITNLDELFSKFIIDNLDLHSKYQILLNREINKDICKQQILMELETNVNSEDKSIKHIITQFLYLYGNCKTCNLPIPIKDIARCKDSQLILPILSKETIKYVKDNKIKFGDYKQLFPVYETNEYITILEEYNYIMIQDITKYFENI